MKLEVTIEIHNLIFLITIQCSLTAKLALTQNIFITGQRKSGGRLRKCQLKLHSFMNNFLHLGNLK